MYYPSKKEFFRLVKMGNLIPVYKEILADLETPVSAFMKIEQGNYSYLLESVEGHERIARYSFLGSEPSFVFKSKGRDIQMIKIRDPGSRIQRFTTKDDPLFEIERFMRDYRFVPIKGLPRFCGGLVGYIGYEMIRFFEDRLSATQNKNPDDLGLPDALFLFTDTLVIFDHLNHKIKIVSNVYVPNNCKDRNHIEKIYEMAIKKIEDIERRLKRPLKIRFSSSPTVVGKIKKTKVSSNFTKREFQDIVKRAKEHIKKGDIIQVVLSQRFHLKLNKNPFDIYRSLRSINPSPYMFYLKFKDFHIIGSSPESLVRCEDKIVQTRPIAGTRPRGRDEEEDQILMNELLDSPKEKAEHLMLVDLGRNDLGRVCRYGTVRVSQFMVVEKYSHVMHLVSDVVGRLKKGKDIYDVLRCAFPAGTVCGAPKIRAMEIIDELETVKRGPYAGCVGYFSFSRNLDTCITIRAILVKDKSAYIQAGAGIVADSDPRMEYLETVNKAKAQIEAVRCQMKT